MLSRGKKPPPPAVVEQELRRLEIQASRSDPLHFAGRRDIINDVLSYAGDLPPGGAKGNTVAILGAPGAGKTALVCEIARQANARGGMKAVVLEDVPESPERTSDAYWEIVAGLCGISPEISRTTTAESFKGAASVPGVLSLGGGADSIVAPPRIDSVRGIARIANSRGMPFENKVIVLIDEIQNIEPDGAAQMLARDLHTQGTAPVLLVCAGLSDGRDRMEEARLTRVENVYRLEPLSRDESVDVARQTMAKVQQALHLPGAAESLDELAEAIAYRSEGFPMHIQNDLRGVWRALFRHSRYAHRPGLRRPASG